MKRIKELRQLLGYTQDDLAKMLKTTQQTIARWEAGKVEPGISAIRDLAVIFETSVDDLLGTNPFSSKPITHRFLVQDNSAEHWWGHLGVMLPGAKLSQWYPVTEDEANRVSKMMLNTDPESPWIVVSTLNNRMLVINVLAVKRIQLLDDNADQITDDWQLGWDSYQGYSPEIYRALADWFAGEPVGYSDAFKKAVRGIIEEHKLDEELVWERVIKTVVHYRDGSMQSIRVEESNLWSVVSGIDLDQPNVFDLSNRDEGLDRYIPAPSIHMIDMPLYQVVDAAKSKYEELEAEIKAAEVVAKAKKPRGRPRKATTPPRTA